MNGAILYTKWRNDSLNKMHNLILYLTNILEVQVVSPMVSPFGMPEYTVFFLVFPRARE